MLYALARPLLFTLDAEVAHGLTIAALKAMPAKSKSHDPLLATRVGGLDLPSPVGLAAGFDKHGEVPDAMLSLGFGFVEVGTVTPLLQAGNPKPRLFRLAPDRAVINRFGFNSVGIEGALANLRKRPSTRNAGGVVGINVGANKDSADRIADYVSGVEAFRDVADYLTINISSPNTPGLRGLQGEPLTELLLAVAAVRGTRPVFLKVAPDLDARQADAIVKASVDARIDALIVSNTTVERPHLNSIHAGEAGGLSGEPLKALALDALRLFRDAAGGAIPLIGAGGIASADDAWRRIRAGASAVQLYTALVYEGPALARRINAGLAARLREGGYASIAEAVGRL
ncbi:quinone-dependent dihydroorotate dehydrogenase [Sphingomonas antarctica]|uniref:quinone-dependent dihydroorotate dehydrogenase n=1 Tax=Sphingomonas antarctica TaxID=2040274 RepID=UPI0039ED5F29